MAKMLILSSEPNNWVPQQLKIKAEEAGWDTEIINPDECYINVSEEPYISYKGTKFLGADVCIPRLSEKHEDYKVAIMDHLAKMNVQLLNTSESMRLASSKLQTQIILNANGIRTPKSAMFVNYEQLEFAHNSIGGQFPVVIKTVTGTHGIGVMRIDSMASLVGVIQQLIKTNTEFMLQEYVKHETSSRILMLNGEMLAAVSRSVPEDDFRANAHEGSKLTAITPTAEEIELTRKVCNLIGTKFGAIDYATVDEGFLVFELNGSPGYEEMQKVVDVDITQKIIDSLKPEIKQSVEKPAEVVPPETPAEMPAAETPPPVVAADVEVEKSEVLTDDLSQEISDEEPVKEQDDSDGGGDMDMDDEESEDDEKTHTGGYWGNRFGVWPFVVDFTPAKVAKVEVKQKDEDEKVPIIGTVQKFAIKHFNDNKPITARIDTGATHSSLHGTNIVINDNLVSFDFNGVKYRCHLVRSAKIRVSATGESVERPVVNFDIEINGVPINNVEFSINERSNMKFEALLGRSALAAAGVLIDPSLGNVNFSKDDFEESTEEDKKELANETE